MEGLSVEYPKKCTVARTKKRVTSGCVGVWEFLRTCPQQPPPCRQLLVSWSFQGSDTNFEMRKESSVLKDNYIIRWRILKRHRSFLRLFYVLFVQVPIFLIRCLFFFIQYTSIDTEEFPSSTSNKRRRRVRESFRPPSLEEGTRKDGRKTNEGFFDFAVTKRGTKRRFR